MMNWIKKIFFKYKPTVSKDENNSIPMSAEQAKAIIELYKDRRPRLVGKMVIWRKVR